MDDVLDRLCNLWSAGIHCGPNYELLVRYKHHFGSHMYQMNISLGCHSTPRLRSCSCCTWSPPPRGAPPTSTGHGSIPPSQRTRRRSTSPSISSNQKPSKQSNNGSQLVCKGSVSQISGHFSFLYQLQTKQKAKQKFIWTKIIFTRRCRHANRDQWRRRTDAALPEVLFHDGL